MSTLRERLALVAMPMVAVQSIAMTAAFSGDPRTPVLIGGGQFAQHVDTVEDALDPVGLMCEAIRRAASNAGLTTPPNPDALAVVSLLSWRYGDPAFLIAEQLALKPSETVLTTNG